MFKFIVGWILEWLIIFFTFNLFELFYIACYFSYIFYSMWSWVEDVINQETGRILVYVFM